jgi:hypothetical protein
LVLSRFGAGFLGKPEQSPGQADFRKRESKFGGGAFDSSTQVTRRHLSALPKTKTALFFQRDNVGTVTKVQSNSSKNASQSKFFTRLLVFGTVVVFTTPAAALLSPVQEEAGPPGSGGCDVAGIACAAAVATAGYACLNETVTATTHFDGQALHLIPVSGDAKTQISIDGCLSWAGGGIIGMLNEMPGAVDWDFHIGWRGYRVLCSQATDGNCHASQSSTCAITDIGIGKFCVDAYGGTNSGEWCAWGSARVTVNGDPVHTVIGIPLNGNTVSVASTHANGLAGCSGIENTADVLNFICGIAEGGACGSEASSEDSASGQRTRVTSANMSEPLQQHLQDAMRERVKRDIHDQIGHIETQNGTTAMRDALGRAVASQIEAKTTIDQIEWIVTLPPQSG